MRRFTKTLCSFRLSDAARDNLQECVDLHRKIYGLRDEWFWEKTNRTEALTKAVDYYLSHLRAELAQVQAKQPVEKPPTKKARRA